MHAHAGRWRLARDERLRVARGGQQQRRRAGQRTPQQRQRRVRVAEQHDHALAGARRDAVRGQPGVAVERRAACEQPRLAQQPAGGRREAGVEEMLDQPAPRPRRLRRGQAVAALDPVLGAEVFEVEPGRRGAPGACLRGHARDVACRRVAGKGLDDNRAGCGRLGLGPGPRLHPDRALRRHPGQRRGFVAPQPHRVAAPAEVAREPPADAEVAVVVDDAAEQVPGQRRRHARIIEVRPAPGPLLPSSGA